MNTLRILVPVDFSDASIPALESAGFLAQLTAGVITPFHTMLVMPHSYTSVTSHLSRLQIDYKKLGKDLRIKLDHMAQRYVDSKYLRPAIIDKGLSTASIIKASGKHDVIVMSSHGRSGYRRYLMGSVAEEVLRLSKIPVLIIKDNARLQSVNKILVCTDFSTSSLAAFPWAVRLAKKAQARLEVVNVLAADTEKNSMIEKMADHEQKVKALVDEYLGDYRAMVTSKVILTDQLVFETLSDYIDKERYDLVVMATLGHSELDYALMGSTTANLIRFSNSPVLAVRPQKSTGKSLLSGMEINGSAE